MNEQKFHNKNSIFDIEKPAKRSIKETSEKSLEVANENFVSNTKKSFYLATSNIDTHFKATIGLVHGEYRRIVNICSGEMRNSNNNIEFGKKAFLSIVSSVKKTFSSGYYHFLNKHHSFFLKMFDEKKHPSNNQTT